MSRSCSTEEAAVPEIPADLVAAIVFTSGSTGTAESEPKALG